MDFSVSCQLLIGRSLGSFASISLPGNGLLIGGCLPLGLIWDFPAGAPSSAFSGWRFPACGQRDLSVLSPEGVTASGLAGPRVSVIGTRFSSPRALSLNMGFLHSLHQDTVTLVVQTHKFKSSRRLASVLRDSSVEALDELSGVMCPFLNYLAATPGPPKRTRRCSRIRKNRWQVLRTGTASEHTLRPRPGPRLWTSPWTQVHASC